MKALVVTHLGRQPGMVVEERNLPAPKSGYSLIRMHAATVNPLSHLVRTGRVPTASAPLVLSNDGSGIVESSDSLAPGTRVAIYGGGQLGITEDGLQQQWAVVEDKRLIELPRSFDLDEGAALPINYVTAHQALTRAGKVCAGQHLLISGASGSVGTALIQTARALGATPIGIVSSTAKVERATQAGAAHVIDLSRQNLREAVLAITDGSGADKAFDPVGGPLIGQLLSAVKQRGELISIGFVGGVNASIDVQDLVVHEKKIVGYDAWLETDDDVNAAFSSIRQFIQGGYLRPAIDSVFALEDHALAYQRLNSREATGTILLRLDGAAR